MKQKTVIKQAIELLEQQRKSLQEMDLLGVLLENELTHKSNQINTIQLLLAKLLPIEEKQIIDAVEWNYKSNMGQVYYDAVYGVE